MISTRTNVMSPVLRRRGGEARAMPTPALRDGSLRQHGRGGRGHGTPLPASHPGLFPSASLGLSLGFLLLTAGCQRDAPAPDKPPTGSAQAGVRVVRPERKTVRYPIEQPGFNIEAFEETLIYPRISGYVGKWTVDIGKTVEEGQLLAELNVP